MTMVVASVILAVTGCEKVPTWSELTGEKKITPTPTPAPAPFVNAHVETPPVKPLEPSAEEIIARFKSYKSHEISDTILSQLTSLNIGLDQVTEINADGSLLTSQAFSSIDRLTNLQQLRLNNSRVDNEACTKLASVPSLQVLALTDTAVNDVGVAALSSLPNLKHLKTVLQPLVRCLRLSTCLLKTPT
jgi:hypothetical protein